MIGVLICDDSGLVRATLRKIIDSTPGMKVIDYARHGAEAVEKAKRLKPDVVTMDIYMPMMDGIAALKEIVRCRIAPVIMISGATRKDANAAVNAMQAGAFDFIAKPDEGTDLEVYGEDIVNKIKEAATSNLYAKLHAVTTAVPDISTEKEEAGEAARPGKAAGFKAVVLGVSTGGPKTIYNVLPYLPPTLNAAIIVVQHMPPAFLSVFAKQVDKKTVMECVETKPGMHLEPGRIYIAKGGLHMKLFKRANGDMLIRHSNEPHHTFMPSVDITMKAVLKVFGTDTIGVLMTGMGRDGAEGMVDIVKAGGKTIAESEQTAIVFGMPREAIKQGGATYVLPNHQIANQIISLVEGK